MKQLYIIVEGPTEEEFVKRILIPYFTTKGLHTNIQPILILMKGGGYGFNNMEHFGNTIKPIMYYRDEPIITTMIDHYGINSEQKLKGYSNCKDKRNVEERIGCMEEALRAYVNTIKPYPNFIPNIIRHEFETLLFSNPIEGFGLENDEIIEAVTSVRAIFLSTEDINSTPEGAPSKRLEAIYQSNNEKYAKIVDGFNIADLTGIEKILEECPRFKAWVDLVIKRVLTS
ncbi:MAG: DUF4276 family protein [Spirosomataceae bacterium]